MNRNDFTRVRRHLEKTQSQMAQLLGISLKGIQSFEQGWRGVPATAERELLILLGLRTALIARKRPCWAVKECPEENRRRCPVWEFGAGNICWFMNGTLCQGKPPSSWDEKSKICRKCEVFQSVFDLPRRLERKSSPANNGRAGSKPAFR